MEEIQRLCYNNNQNGNDNSRKEKKKAWVPAVVRHIAAIGRRGFSRSLLGIHRDCRIKSPRKRQNGVLGQ